MGSKIGQLTSHIDGPERGKRLESRMGSNSVKLFSKVEGGERDVRVRGEKETL